MTGETASRPLVGRRIAMLESREAALLAAMLRRQGAEILACPLVAIVDPADPAPVALWLDRFIAAPCDDLVLYTGEGLDRLAARAGRSGRAAAFRAALGGTRTIVRGPKPARALRALGLEPGLRAEPPTTDGLLTLCAAQRLAGRRVGVQFYPGAADRRLADFLCAVGAEPDPVVPYEYAPAVARAAVVQLIDALSLGMVDAIAFTGAAQVRRLFAVAREDDREDLLRAGLRRTPIAAVGPVVADELRQHGAPPSIMPGERFFLKPLVSALVAALSR